MKLLLNTLKLIQEEGPWLDDAALCHNVQHIAGILTTKNLDSVFKKMYQQGLIGDVLFPVKGGCASFSRDSRNKSFWSNQDRWDLLNLTIRFIEAGCPPYFGESKWTRLLRFLRLS